ncbi:MAG: 2,3-diaminopropionate biosynthesis protein SbnA [Catenulispora sp.]|nr:2,3-diaminopropionate biosynthesis protein SbnA [Catenulispora sp.]
MRGVARGILETVGDTPLVELARLMPDFPGRIYAKLERANPGGSIKDRAALTILRDGLRSGAVVAGRTTVVESSSGNLAIGLAQACRCLGLDLVCVVDRKTTDQNIRMLRALGARVEVVRTPDPESGEYLPARLARVREIVAANPDAFWPNQYANPLNPIAQRQTMHEIAQGLGGRVDYLFAATSTCGTLLGCMDYIREQGMGTRTVAVDAVGSVLFGHAPRPRLLPGHGASVRTPLSERARPDLVAHVTDLDCVLACRRLARREGFLAGGSSGATIAALRQLAGAIEPGAVCVLIFPDGGDRYLDTIYSDEWVRGHFGEIPDPDDAPLLVLEGTPC